jgi:hypothetical protein
MNNLIKSLTFITVIVGSMSVIAGVFGMNFEVEIFKSASGFWETIAGMVILAGFLTLTAKFLSGFKAIIKTWSSTFQNAQVRSRSFNGMAQNRAALQR